ncbi:MAG TPA: hypothetical protein PKJ83_00205 [Cyclobacteriaceae bacterium]|nr:hypothetical protein [Cyclobacteriaceae bacterium]HPW60845.1 hypothetical protein [Cyclobacteriaceae bacterium]
MAVAKKRIIKSLENLSEDLRDLLKDQYPNGYEASITRITNAKREPIFVFPLETDDSVYLVKVPATKNSDGGYDVESSEKQEFEGDDDDIRTPAADDDFDNSGSDDDFDGDGPAKEASYDPDFDN